MFGCLYIWRGGEGIFITVVSVVWGEQVHKTARGTSLLSLM